MKRLWRFFVDLLESAGSHEHHTFDPLFRTNDEIDKELSPS